MKLGVSDSSDDDKSEKEHKRDRKDLDKRREKKERHSSSDKRERRDSSDKVSHRRKSSDADRDKDRKYKDDKTRDNRRDKDDDKYRNKDRSRDDKYKDKEKYGEKERHKRSSSEDRKEKRKDDERYKDRHYYRERRDSKERERKEKDDYRERRDSKERERKEQDDRKRKRSGSRSDERKREDSKRDRKTEKDRESDSEKPKQEVTSTSVDVKAPIDVITIDDDDIDDTLPTSTVKGSPEIMEVKERNHSPHLEHSPRLFIHEAPYSPGPPSYPSDSPEYIPSLPEDEVPLPPPLPDRAKAPPLPDGEYPHAPPLPVDDSPATPPSDDNDCPDAAESPRNVSNTPPFAPNNDLKKTRVNDQQNGGTPPPILPKPVPPPKIVPPPKMIEPEPTTAWDGVINMPLICKFSASAFEVSGDTDFMSYDVPNSIECVGRIQPERVWKYISQMKKSRSKEMIVVRFQPTDVQEKIAYIELYSYLSSKDRYAVIGSCAKSIKDFYIIPLASQQPIPQVLLPLEAPGFQEHRPHMLIGVIIRRISEGSSSYGGASDEYDPFTAYNPSDVAYNPSDSAYNPSQNYKDHGANRKKSKHGWGKINFFK